MASETTAAATGAVGRLRFDPMAMLPFCGYNMADYWAHWLHIGGQTDATKLPKIFFVNWFRKSAEGKWLWPGYGENSRVLKWVFEQVSGAASAVETPIGLLPSPDAIDTSGLAVSSDDMAELLRVDIDGWRANVGEIEQHYARFGDRLPDELAGQLRALEKRLASA
jgi:phosphoenolpyruvate carboxykinase (GTP)